MWDLPFEIRVIALLGFLGLASCIELVIRGGEAVRWRGSILIVSLGFLGAMMGFAIDLVTSSISPAYFAVGKGLGWEAGLSLRSCILGLQAGASAGVVIGCVFSYINYRGDLPPLRFIRVLQQASYPMAAAVFFGVFLGSVGALFPPQALLDAVRPTVSAGQEGAFLRVWFAHAGVYLGAITGLVVSAVRIQRARRRASAREG